LWGDGEILFVPDCDFLHQALAVFVNGSFVGFGGGLGITPVVILVDHGCVGMRG